MSNPFFHADNIKGRGSAKNIQNRFDQQEILPEEDYWQDIPSSPKTHFQYEKAKSIISKNDSPDVPFKLNINPYQGCEHGCPYCYARPYHEYLGLSAGLDFETKIFIKKNAPEILKKTLSKKSWEPDVIGLSGITDPYQPIERKEKLTRQCLEILANYQNPTGIITKNHLVLRDLDLLERLHSFQGVFVLITLTTLDSKLASHLEPRAAHPQARLKAMEMIAKKGIPVGLLLSPVIPSINDEEIPEIIKQAASYGASFCRYGLIRLPHSVKETFQDWLTHFYPERKEKILNRIKESRGGKLYDSNFESRLSGTGKYAKQLEEMVTLWYKKYQLSESKPKLNTSAFRNPTKHNQYHLFD